MTRVIVIGAVDDDGRDYAQEYEDCTTATRKSIASTRDDRTAEASTGEGRTEDGTEARRINSGRPRTEFGRLTKDGIEAKA